MGSLAWCRVAELGPQAADTSKAHAVECRTCGHRLELEAADAIPAECPECETLEPNDVDG